MTSSCMSYIEFHMFCVHLCVNFSRGSNIDDIGTTNQSTYTTLQLLADSTYTLTITPIDEVFNQGDSKSIIIIVGKVFTYCSISVLWMSLQFSKTKLQCIKFCVHFFRF